MTNTSDNNFIHDIIERDIAAGMTRIQTRFPPEPNGFLHIGHAKAVWVNYRAAMKYNGEFNLRFDDTNPLKEDINYVESIIEDLNWLGCPPVNIYYASDYFPFLHECAVKLINKGLAYVDDQTAEEIRATRGTLTQGGKNSPYRDRSVEENLELFKKMTAGVFPNGHCVLRAKIDMTSPNINMRDPVMYRIIHTEHFRTGDTWCIYPNYDFAHGLSDFKEGVTHSLCSLEFENNRPLYDWFLKACDCENPSKQIEFARMNLEYSLPSTRKTLKLVEANLVNGWDDPRLSTLRGLRRRGVTPEAIRDFCDRIGVSKSQSFIEIGQFESAIRDDLNANAARCMAVLEPLEVEIINYDKVEQIIHKINPNDEMAGERVTNFSKHIYIERSDFEEEPPKGFKRLVPDGFVRLKGAYIIKCVGVEKDESGNVIKLLAEYAFDSKSGNDTSGIKPKGVIHWVNRDDAVTATINVYEKLFTALDPSAAEDILKVVNENSCKILKNCKVEPDIAKAKPGKIFQFMRNGYFAVDPSSTSESPVLNKTISLKDGFKK